MNIAPITSSVSLSRPSTTRSVETKPAIDSAPDRFECGHDHDAEVQPDWGFQGHGLVQEVAAESLPVEMPEFFRGVPRAGFARVFYFCPHHKRIFE